MSSPSKKKKSVLYTYLYAELFYFISHGSVLDVSQFYFVFVFCFLQSAHKKLSLVFYEYKPDVDDYHTKEVQYEKKTLSTTRVVFYFILFL
jgi:hypothetical protein